MSEQVSAVAYILQWQQYLNIITATSRIANFLFIIKFSCDNKLLLNTKWKNFKRTGYYSKGVLEDYKMLYIYRL